MTTMTTDPDVELVQAWIAAASDGEYAGTSSPSRHGWTIVRADGAPLAFYGDGAPEPVYGAVKRIQLPYGRLTRRHRTVLRAVAEAVAFARHCDTIHHPEPEARQP